MEGPGKGHKMGEAGWWHPRGFYSKCIREDAVRTTVGPSQEQAMV